MEEPATGAHVPLAKAGIREGIPPSGKPHPAEEGVGEGLGIRTRSSLSSGQSDSLCRGSPSAQEPLEPGLKDRAIQAVLCKGGSVLWPFFVCFTTVLVTCPLLRRDTVLVCYVEGDLMQDRSSFCLNSSKMLPCECVCVCACMHTHTHMSWCRVLGLV